MARRLLFDGALLELGLVPLEHSISSVSSTLDVQWSITSEVSSTTDLQWSINTSATSSVEAQWSILEFFASNEINISWHLDTEYVATFTVEILTPITNTVEIQWSTIASVEATVELPWSILEGTSNTLEIPWNYLTDVSSLVEFQWDIQVITASNSLTIPWHINTEYVAEYPVSIASPVSSELDLRWSLEAGISSTLEVVWSSVEDVLQTIQIDWSVLNSADAQVELEWSSLAAIDSSEQIIWNTLQSAESSVEFQWSLLSGPSADLDIRWDLIAVAADQLELQWSALESAETVLELNWSVISTSSQTLELTWESLEEVSSTLNLPWDIQGDTATSTLSISWHINTEYVAEYPVTIANSVTSELDLQWATLNSATNTAEIVWQINTSAQNNVEIVWSSIAPVSSITEIQWSIASIEVSSTLATSWVVLNAGYDFVQITEVGGIWADDLNVEVGDYHFGYYSLGSGDPITSTGLLENIQLPAAYTYSIYDVSLDSWSNTDTESFYDSTVSSTLEVQWNIGSEAVSSTVDLRWHLNTEYVAEFPVNIGMSASSTIEIVWSISLPSVTSTLASSWVILNSGYDFVQITAVGGIWADDPDAIIGRYHFGYYSSGTGDGVTTGGILDNVQVLAEYTYQLYNPSTDTWSSFVTEYLYGSSVYSDLSIIWALGVSAVSSTLATSWVTLNAGYDFVQIATVGGIWLDDTEAEVGAFHFGYYSLGSGDPINSSGILDNIEFPAEYTYQLYVNGAWTSEVTEILSPAEVVSTLEVQWSISILSASSTLATSWVTLNAGYDFVQITEVGGIWADDVDVSVGDYHFGYYSLGSGDPITSSGILDNIEFPAQYTYQLYSVSENSWSSLASEDLYPASIEAALSLVWDIEQQGEVQNTVTIIWNTLSSASNILDVRWNSVEAITSPIELRWSSEEAVVSAIEFIWASEGTVESHLEIVWDSTIEVWETIELPWGILNSVEAQETLVWSTLESVQESTSLEWSVIEGVENSTEIRWGYEGQVFSELELVWDLTSSASTALELNWSIIQSAQAELETLWSVIASAEANLALEWNINWSVESGLVLPWDILNPIDQDISFLWSSVQAASANIRFLWNLNTNVRPMPDYEFLRINISFPSTMRPVPMRTDVSLIENIRIVYKEPESIRVGGQ